MNNRVLLIIAVFILAIGVLVLFAKQKKHTAMTTQATPTLQPTAQQTTTTPATSGAQPSQAMKQEETKVTLTDNGFSPQTITIKTGTKVTWTNNSSQTGNVSSNPHPIHTDFPPLNLGNIDVGSSVSLVFDKPGTHNYHNHLNPSQQGTVIVQ